MENENNQQQTTTKEKQFAVEVIKQSKRRIVIDSKQLYEMQDLDLHVLCQECEKLGYRVIIVKGARRIALEKIGGAK